MFQRLRLSILLGEIFGRAGRLAVDVARYLLSVLYSMYLFCVVESLVEFSSRILTGVQPTDGRLIA